MATFRIFMSHLSTPAGFPAWETQAAAPQSAPITTQFHIKHKSQDIAVDAIWREVTKAACCFKDGALWHDSKPTLIISYQHIEHSDCTFSKNL